MKEVRERVKELGLDTKWLDKLIETFPKDGSLAIETAKTLVGQFWSAATTLTDYLTVARREANKAKLAEKAYYAIARNAAEDKTDAAKKRTAEADVQYHTLCACRDRAEEVKDWLDLKRDDIIRGHHLCKEVVRAATQDWHNTPKEELHIEAEL